MADHIRSWAGRLTFESERLQGGGGHTEWGLADVSRSPALTEALSSSEWTEDEFGGLIAENILERTRGMREAGGGWRSEERRAEQVIQIKQEFPQELTEEKHKSLRHSGLWILLATP